MDNSNPVRRYPTGRKKTVMDKKRLLIILAGILAILLLTGILLLASKGGRQAISNVTSSPSPADSPVTIEPNTKIPKKTLYPDTTSTQRPTALPTKAMPTQTPVSSLKPSVNVAYETKTLKESTATYNYECSYLVFTNLPNKDVQDKWNKQLEEKATQNIKYVKENDGINYSDPGSSWYMYSGISWVSQYGDIVSIFYGEEGYTGGAHPYHSMTSYVFNITTGYEYKLSDLFSPGFDCMNYLYQKSKMIFAEDISDYEMSQFTKLDDDQMFVLSDNKLILIVNEYQYFSYMTGSPSAELPLSQFGANFTLFDVTGGKINTYYANVSSSSSFLNIRQSNSTTAGVLGVLHRQEAVQVLETKGEWSKILTANNVTGYVKTQYLSKSPSLK